MKTKSSNRRQPTAEQKEAARIRREQIKQLLAQVKAIPTEKRILLANAYGIRNCEGRELSPYNQCLLAAQNANVTVVGGFSQWRALDRVVRKGVRALAIWVPTSRKIGELPANTPDCTAIVPHGTEPDASSLSSSSFIIGNVFDIADTMTVAEWEASKLNVIDEAPALQETNCTALALV